jgi:hypothetical protein
MGGTKPSGQQRLHRVGLVFFMNYACITDLGESHARLSAARMRAGSISLAQTKPHRHSPLLIGIASIVMRASDACTDPRGGAQGPLGAAREGDVR